MVRRRACLTSLLALAAGKALPIERHTSPDAAISDTRGEHDFSVGAVDAAPSLDRPPGFAGSYIQLWHRHQQWHPADWDALFDAMASLRLGTLIVQWTRVGDLRFDRVAQLGATSGVPPPLQAILARAQQRSMRVMVGLDHETSWWSCAKLDEGALERYLARRAQGTLALARSLAPQLNGHAAFLGWYLSEEIDPQSFALSPAQGLLRDFLRQLVNGLRALAPQARIGVSGFVPTGISAARTGQFWTALLGTPSPIDILLMQDGIGVGAHSFAQWTQILHGLRPAVDAIQGPCGESVELWPVVEAFTQTAGPGRDAGLFMARPAPPDRLMEQLRIAAQAGPAIAFSVPDYLVPQAGAQALLLYRAYREAGLAVPTISLRPGCAVTRGPARVAGPVAH